MHIIFCDLWSTLEIDVQDFIKNLRKGYQEKPGTA